jgi:hypothetical protein
MNILLIVGVLSILGGYGYWMYNQGYNSGLFDGALSIMVALYKDKQVTKVYIMKNIPSLTNEEFNEIFEEKS